MRRATGDAGLSLIILVASMLLCGGALWFIREVLTALNDPLLRAFATIQWSGR